MMSCVTVDAQLADYLAGRLNAVEAEALEAHAAACDRCGAILEERGRLDVTLPLEIAPDPRVKDAVLDRVAPNRVIVRHAQWFVPTAIAATLLLVLSLARPGTKSGQGAPPRGSPAALAAERADGEFRQLDAARAELRDAIAKSPRDPILLRALERLDAQRKSLENLIQEFES